MKILLISLGASLGALSRYYLADVLNKLTFINLPIGILSVNFIGCFILGLLINSLDPKLEHIFNPLLFIGFLGSFTTFSAFSRETIDLFFSGNIILASSYILLTVFSCLLGTWCGMLITKHS
jgi:CrcB protein